MTQSIRSSLATYSKADCVSYARLLKAAWASFSFDQKLERRIALTCSKVGFANRLPPEVRHATESRIQTYVKCLKSIRPRQGTEALSIY